MRFSILAVRLVISNMQLLQNGCGGSCIQLSHRYLYEIPFSSIYRRDGAESNCTLKKVFFPKVIQIVLQHFRQENKNLHDFERVKIKIYVILKEEK